jgi:hypothetical protein
MSDSLTHTATTKDGATRAVLVGVRAAWRAPSIIANDFAILLVPPAEMAREATAGRLPSIAVRVAHRTLGLLARVRPARWRTSCLHRSVAECVALRAYGLPARIVIGVGNGAAPAATIAHAWVECEGVSCRSTRGAAELEMLAPTRA